jgi:alpha-D-ribose 1-methylphosphonate 5-triphosphate synthase subunit PhnH
MLLDQSCTFVALARDEKTTAALTAQIGFLTSAVPAPGGRVEQAHFALIAADAAPGEQAALIEGLSGGSALSPERGATVIIESRQLGTGPFLWEVTGPGVESLHRFASSENAWFAGRALRHDEFPCGIDLILIDEQGNLAALPRTANINGCQGCCQGARPPDNRVPLAPSLSTERGA